MKLAIVLALSAGVMIGSLVTAVFAERETVIRCHSIPADTRTQCGCPPG